MPKLTSADKDFWTESYATYDGSHTPVTDFQPNPGGQERFIQSQAHEIIAMGANSSGKTFCSLIKCAHHLIPERDIEGNATGFTIHPHRRIRINSNGIEGWISTWSEKTQRGNIEPAFEKILGPYELKEGTKIEAGVRQLSQFESGRITFKYQTMSIDAYKGEKIDFAMLDEPHKKQYYNETNARTWIRKGTVWMAATLIADATYSDMKIDDIIWMQEEIIDPWLDNPDNFPETEIVFMTMEENAAYLDVEFASKRMRSMSKEEQAVRKTGRLIVHFGKCCFNDEILKVIKHYIRNHPEECQPTYGRLEYDDYEDDEWKVKFTETRTYFDDNPRDDFIIKIWQHPIDRNSGFIRPEYFIGADVAEGVDGGDYTSVCVKRADSGEEVAALHGHLTEIELARELWLIGMYYCNDHFEPARLAIEVTNIGKTTQSYLISGNAENQIPKYGLNRIYHRPSDSQLASGLFMIGKNSKPGWMTSRGSRHYIITAMRQDILRAYEAIERGEPSTIKDMGRIEEAETFILHPDGKYKPRHGKRDDKLFGAAICDQAIKRYSRQPKPILGGDVFYKDTDKYYHKNGEIFVNNAALDRFDREKMRRRTIKI